MIGLVLAAQIAIVARGPDTASACLPIELTVAARAPGAIAPRIELPLGAPLQLLRASLVTRSDRDGAGRPWSTSEGTFVVATSAIGRVVLPPFIARVGSAEARAAPSSLVVGSPDVTPPIVLVRASLDRDGRRADSVYVGEQVDYVVDVHLNEPARQRLRRNPTFFPPDMPAVLAYDLPAPRPLVREGRRCFETLTYRRALFPLFPGVAAIPPAVLTYSLPLSSSFFSREESFERRTDSVGFVAVDPPAASRPADFAGAVGTLRASARLASLSGRMGDPIVLTVRLEGRGNVKLLPRPTLSIDWASIALGEERVSVDTSAARVRGTKEFDWILTPRRAGPLRVPPLRYVHFDPERGEYAAAVTDPLALEVSAAALASADTATTTRLAIRATLRPERPPELPTRGWFWALALLAPAPASLLRARARARRRASALSPARRLRALGTSSMPPEPRELRRAYLDTLRDRVPALASTSRAPLGRALRRAGVTEATARAAEELLERLDVAAFSPWGVADPALVARALSVAAAVDAEAVRPLAMPSAAISALLVVALLGGAATLSARPGGVERTFGEGVQAYERGQFGAAQRLFARAAARAPRAADAWANLGTAAWAREDSAHAALGWQRALRLDPLDGDARERLSLLPPSLVGAPGHVPPVPVDAVALAALTLWVAAWLAFVVPPARRPVSLRAVAGGALVLAVVALGAALELRDRSSVRGLGALRAGRTLLAAPTPGAAPAAAGSAGEVGRLGAREGVWVRMTLDGARAGWLPVAAVLPLDAAGAD